MPLLAPAMRSTDPAVGADRPDGQETGHAHTAAVRRRFDEGCSSATEPTAEGSSMAEVRSRGCNAEEGAGMYDQ